MWVCKGGVLGGRWGSGEGDGQWCDVEGCGVEWGDGAAEGCEGGGRAGKGVFGVLKRSGYWGRRCQLLFAHWRRDHCHLMAV